MTTGYSGGGLQGVGFGLAIDAIAPNGKRGYCKTHKKRWKLERVPTTELGKMQPGQIQHEDLIPFEEDLMRWSYRIVGHYVQDTLEQWELGDQFSNVLTFRRRRFGFVQHAVPHSSQRRLFGVLTRPERFRRNKISSAKKAGSSTRQRVSARGCSGRPRSIVVNGSLLT